MKTIARFLIRIIDILLTPFVFLAAWLLKLVRLTAVRSMPWSRKILMHVGVYPILDHYYEPQFDHRSPSQDYGEDRDLPGIDWNEAGQLEMLDQFTYSAELMDIPSQKTEALEFHFNNGNFESGDAECWYQMIRVVKPRRIIEIGSGNSTLMAVRATRKNKADDPAYACEHICIEPYEMPWLESTGVTVVRQKVETLELSYFARLQANDILFIDSSHIIRPQGDVLFEYLQLLPTLSPGVIVHIHDIFSPKNYLQKWLQEDTRFWNEQYLLEAFLSHNASWKVIAALNFLHHKHYGNLSAAAPYLTKDREPGSFYIRKN